MCGFVHSSIFELGRDSKTARLPEGKRAVAANAFAFLVRRRIEAFVVEEGDFLAAGLVDRLRERLDEFVAAFAGGG